MKIAIIGAAGLRTPLLIQSIIARQTSLGLRELTLMDINGEHLELISALTSSTENSSQVKFKISCTTDPVEALTNSDFVITTFRVGGIESRAIDERVPLSYGVLGQETTGPGGFAMGIRSIPVILDYVHKMESYCPNAWLINFANPAGMLTEAVIRQAGWFRVVGICDAPSSMHRIISATLGAGLDDVYLDYFGLNHLGWIKRIIYNNQNQLPELIHNMNSSGGSPGLPFDIDLINSLQMIPNEYLYYYYYNNQTVNNILNAGVSRGEQISRLNLLLFKELREKYSQHDFDGMNLAYHNYLKSRGESYMVTETGKQHKSDIEQNIIESFIEEGYGGVALNLIEALIGKKPGIQILNVPNRLAIYGIDELSVVEIPCFVQHDQVQPMAVGEVPDHCLGLMIQIKDFEHLTIAAAVEGSYHKARMALAGHPLVRDYVIAGKILDDYIHKHKEYFPSLQ